MKYIEYDDLSDLFTEEQFEQLVLRCGGLAVPGKKVLYKKSKKAFLRDLDEHRYDGDRKEAAKKYNANVRTISNWHREWLHARRGATQTVEDVP